MKAKNETSVPVNETETQPKSQAPSANGGSSRRPKEDDVAATYNAFKEFEGKRYTGMKIGRSHKWHYDQGEWKETKVTPEEWQIHYAVRKRRAGHAPEGSGVPVGTSYHWYILAHQNVTKENANDYTTSMTGMKFKLAHRRADSDKWSASTQAQRRHLIKILQGVIQDLEREMEGESFAANAATPPRSPRSKARRAAPKKPAKSKKTANGRDRHAA